MSQNEEIGNLSSIVTPVCLPNLSPSENRADVIRFFCEALIRNSAKNIYLTSPDDSLNKEVLSSFPKFIKSRVKLVDEKGKMSDNVLDTLRPLVIDVEKIWEKKREIKHFF